MSNQRTHYVTTTDGVTIGGTVRGKGPALVFLQGIIGDSDLDWQPTVEHLTDRFTCHLPSMRGRGLSGDHSDLSMDRLVADFVAYVESIGEPTGLVGWSGGGSWALYVAALSDSVCAVAPFEPGMLYLLDEPEQAALGGALASTGALAADGMLPEAARAFAGWPFNEKELEAAEAAGYFAAAGRYVPNMLNFIQQAVQSPPAGDPAAPLGAISVPVTVLLGSESKPFFLISAEHVVDNVANAQIQQIPGAGHAAPLTHPEALAEALIEFFSRTHVYA
ncbi:MAG: alpha/beta hydrolase [Homoserinimonas sp.]